MSFIPSKVVEGADEPIPGFEDGLGIESEEEVSDDNDDSVFDDLEANQKCDVEVEEEKEEDEADPWLNEEFIVSGAAMRRRRAELRCGLKSYVSNFRCNHWCHPKERPSLPLATGQSRPG